MADLKKKIRIRGGHRGYVRKTIDAVADILAANNTEELKKLKTLRSTLKEQLKQLKDLDNEIVDLIQEENDIDQEVMDSCEFSAVIQSCITDIDEFFSSSETPGNASASARSLHNYSGR